MKCRLVIHFLTFFLVLTCYAQKTWTGSTNSNWNEASNWSPSGIPTSGDNVVINSGTVNINTTPNADISSLTVNGGTLTVFSSLSLTIGANSTVGSGGILVNSGNLILNADLVVDGQLDFGNGSIQGAGDLIVNGTFNWTNSAAVVSGAGARTNNGTTNIQGALLQTVFTNEGTVNQSGTQTFVLGNGGRYVNNGTHDFQNDRDINENHVGNLGMTNTGSIIKSGGDLASGRSDILVSYDGGGSVTAQMGNIDFRELSTQTGTLTSESGGAIRFPTNMHTFNGATIGGAGYTHFNGGTIDIATNTSATNIDFSSASISGVGDLTISGDLNWSAGDFGNSVDAGKLITSGTATLGGGRLATTWQNDGVVTWTGGSFTLNTNGVLLNNNTFDIQTSQDIFTQGSPQSIQNIGSLIKSAGTSTTILYPNLVNSGTIDAQVGTLRIRGGSNSGDISSTVSSGTVDISSSTFTNQSGGTIGGIGAITVGASLVNEGTISPGTSPGILTISETGGAFSMTSTSELNIELGGNTVGTEYDQLIVSGTFGLDGTLNASLISPFVPNPVDTFNVLDYSSISGFFTNATAADLDSLLLQIIDHEGFIKLIVNYQEAVDVSICDGESIFLEGANQTTAGIYRDTLTSSIGIDSIVISTLTVNPQPTVVANASAMIIQEGETVTLTGSGAVSYAWDNGVTDGVAFMPAATATYTVTGTDANGCMNTDMVTITVNALPNDPPVLGAIGDKQDDELVELSFTATATDPEGDPLTYSLDATSLGQGMTIGSSTGIFSWTPGENQDGVHTVSITVSDGVNTDEETISITINEVNTSPTLANVSNQTIMEGEKLELTFVATDDDLPANTFTYSLDAISVGKGMSVNVSTGLFSWTPGNDDAGAHDVMVTVSDGSASASVDFTINVENVLGLSEPWGVVKIYPNPASESITVSLPENLATLHLRIMDLTGKTIISSILKSPQSSMNINLISLNPGLYHLQITNHDGFEIRKRFIKRK